MKIQTHAYLNVCVYIYTYSCIHISLYPPTTCVTRMRGKKASPKKIDSIVWGHTVSRRPQGIRPSVGPSLEAVSTYKQPCPKHINKHPVYSQPFRAAVSRGSGPLCGSVPGGRPRTKHLINQNTNADNCFTTQLGLAAPRGSGPQRGSVPGGPPAR